MKKQKVEKTIMESFIIPFDIKLDWFIEQCKKLIKKGQKGFLYNVISLKYILQDIEMKLMKNQEKEKRM